MILFTILLIIAVIVLGLAVLTIGTVGAGAILVFAEPIICVVLLVLLFKFLFKKKRK